MFGIVGLLLFEQVVNDQALAGFSQPQLVSKFHLGGAFTAGDDVDVGVVEAKDFVLVLDLSFSNDSFVSLIDGRLDLAEDAFQPILEELDSTFAQLGFAAPLFEQGEVAAGVTNDSFAKGFHFPQNGFAFFPAVLDAVGGGHFHDEAVDVAERDGVTRAAVEFRLANGMVQMGQYFIESDNSGKLSRLVGFVGTGTPT